MTEPLRVTVARSLAQVAPDEWARLATGWPMELSYSWLAAEEGRVASTQFYLLAWHPGGRLLGALAAYHFAGTITHTAYPVHSVLLGSGPDPDPGLHPSLVCVAPSSYHPGVLWNRGLDTVQTRQVVEALVTAFEEHARGLDVAAISILHVASGDTVLTDLLTRHGYAGATVNANAVLRVPPGTFDDYLAMLPPKRRREVGRERRMFLASPLVVRAGGAELLTGSLAPLLVDHYRRYGHSADERGVLDRFRRIQRQGELTVFVAGIGEDIAGFSVFFHDTDRLVARMYAGRRTGAFEYFNLIYYEAAVLAARHGIREIHYGAETFDAKVARGCTLRAKYGYFASVAGHSEALALAVRERSLVVQAKLRVFSLFEDE